MKSLILFISIIILTVPIIEFSYAQKPNSDTILSPKIFLQIQFYDRYGQLYGYAQPRPQIYDMDKTVEWIQGHGVSKNVEIGGQNYTLVKFVDSYSGSHFGQVGYYYLWDLVDGKKKIIFKAWHDSVVTESGDVAKVYWALLVPLK